MVGLLRVGPHTGATPRSKLALVFERAMVTLELQNVKPHSNASDVIDYVKRRIELGYPAPDVDADSWMAPIQEELARRTADGWRLTKAAIVGSTAELRFFRWKLPFGLR